MIKNKYLLYFFILILLGTIFGTVYGGIKSNKREQRLKEAEIVYTIKNQSNHTIIAIENQIYLDEYITALKENQKTVNFPFFSLEEGEKLFILDKISKDLYKVALITYPSTNTRSIYCEFYIWTKFLDINNKVDENGNGSE